MTIDSIGEMLNELLGLDAQKLTVGQMALRAFVVYLFALSVIRLGGERRFNGQFAAFDTILGITVGATFAQAITGSSPFLPTLLAGASLVATHWLFSVAAFRFDRVETWIKGRSRILIRDGQVLREALRSSFISSKDLTSALRSQAQMDGPDNVRVARIESNGQISILPREKQPKIIEVEVREGVQTIKIILDSA